MNYHSIYNHHTTFMEAKNDNGTWAGSDQGWTEGDDWIYVCFASIVVLLKY